LVIVVLLWIGIAPVAMLAPPQARRLGPGGAATQQGPSTSTAMLPVRGKSSENVSGCDFYWAAGLMRQTTLVKRGLLRVRFTPVSRPIRQLDRSSLQCQLPTSREPPLTSTVEPLKSPSLGDGSRPKRPFRSAGSNAGLCPTMGHCPGHTGGSPRARISQALLSSVLYFATHRRAVANLISPVELCG